MRQIIAMVVGIVSAVMIAFIVQAATFTAPLTGTATGIAVTCVNSGSNLCFLLGSYGPDSGSTTWMNRPWDFTAALIGQNQCGLHYPIEAGADNPSPRLGYANYTTQIPANAGCVNSVYTWKLQNEWWLNCNKTNPWYGLPGCPSNKAQAPSTSVAQFKANVCVMVNQARAQYPNAKISWYGPSNDTEAAFDPSDTCQIDVYEIHIYIYGDQIPGRTGKGDWNGGTPYSCAPSGGANGTLPHDVQCTGTTALAYLPTYAANHNKPLSVSEWCSAYNDTASPDGDDYATWAIINWMKFNKVVASQHWSGDPGIAGKSNCTITNQANIRSAMNHAFGGTHYAGTFYTYKTPPSPNPYP